jgi:hypothetical protein
LYNNSMISRTYISGKCFSCLLLRISLIVVRTLSFLHLHKFNASSFVPAIIVPAVLCQK